MSGNISSQGIIPPAAVPGAQEPYAQLIADYPELADEVAALTGWRDGPYDRYNKDFYKQFPSLEPYPWTI